MKITIKEPNIPKNLKFNDLKMGDVFYFKCDGIRCPCMKTNCGVVYLNGGSNLPDVSNLEVILLEAELIIKEK